MPRSPTLERQCALTREVKPVAELIRFAVSPDGELVPDTEARAEGRGVWISLGEKHVAEAIKKRAFEKSLKEKVRLPDDLPALTRKRLTERVQAALAEHQITLNASDLLKEVAVYSDRADISEEIVRLRSHLDQFEKFVQADESAGRKLEFLTQEMFREINTIGSKANDVEISRYVIEIKTAVERIREMIQNVE